jgi:hypothetical protein
LCVATTARAIKISLYGNIIWLITGHDSEGNVLGSEIKRISGISMVDIELEKFEL